MGFSDSSLLLLQTSFLPIQKCEKEAQFVFPRNSRKVASFVVKATKSSLQDKNNDNGTKLVTFLGKGGSGKTTSAVFAAQVLIFFLLFFLVFSFLFCFYESLLLLGIVWVKFY